MSSTRTAKDDSVFHQNRYASSPEFERGLLANLVAKRCALIDAAADRELIWFIQHLSHQGGGLARVAKELMSAWPDRVQTVEMAAMDLKPGKVCNASQVRKLRGAFAGSSSFPLKGEKDDSLWAVEELVSNECARRRADLYEEKRRAESQPSDYPSDDFFKACRDAADSALEKILCEICLNPETSLDHGPWYFPRLIETLREYKANFVQPKGAGVVITALGEKVRETLDYTFYSRGLTLMQGEARTGKSHAARTWCAQHPGFARFVEVPPGNDEIGFFRALARGLGLGNFLNYKTTEILSRVESVLLTGDILLVLDEAQRLWPQFNPRYGTPKRITRVMSWANETDGHPAVPICLISTPQFIQAQKAVEKTGWNSAQLTGRISHFESLPADLSADDLMAVAKSVLPEADTQSLRALAVYARSSARYLAAIDSISKRARYIAMRAGRTVATTEDVRKAMQESVIPADTKLHMALATSKKSKAEPMMPLPESEPPMARVRDASADISSGTLPTRRSADPGALEAIPRARQPENFKAHLIGA
jgi:hypothetical protein